MHRSESLWIQFQLLSIILGPVASLSLSGTWKDRCLPHGPVRLAGMRPKQMLAKGESRWVLPGQWQRVYKGAYHQAHGVSSSLYLHGGRREPTPLHCSLTATHRPCHVCLSAKIINGKNILLKKCRFQLRLYSGTRGSFLRAFILAGTALWQWQQRLEASLKGTLATRVRRIQLCCDNPKYLPPLPSVFFLP